ncbi:MULTISPECIES: DUF349 domain-containing protein [unclassified Fibrobacter]|uniref:DUF349 domain-containing protein n=1 Tax=unclassified Fibrobacter TaxID=2634177 RepID=UPI000D6CD37F|nr:MULTISPECIES: DUF349 domain-containing protein [unclassified Fibrobacter]PWJ64438.1 uncharacterized protein DUF349 [Fibrobacter sp. UWR4]PZW69315.1 uncharacterized protein DUF349 [Fibrobacter sp. UWR1]
MSLFDFVKPNWKKSDPSVRAAAVEKEVSDQSIIETLASSDPDVKVRTAAVKKVASLKVLKAISSNDSDESVKTLAKNRYQDEAYKKLKNLKDVAGEDLDLLNDLKETHFADDLLKNNTTCEAIRKVLVEACKKASILAGVATRDASEAIATIAAKKVDSDALMADIAKNSKHISVRKLVSDKIRAKKEAEDGGKKAAALLAGKQDALLGQAHHLAAQKDPLAVKDQFDNLMAEARALGMGDKQAALDEVYASFNKFCDEANAEKIAAEKAAAEKAAKIAAMTAGLEELEQLISDSKVADNAQRVDEIVALWNDGKSIMDASLIKRYNNAFFKVQEIQKPVVVEVSEGETADESARPELLERLQTLADTDVNESTGKYLHAIVREWEKLPLLEGEDPTLQSYNAIRNKLSEKIAAFTERAQKLVEENSAKLRAIIDKVKSFDENEDFRELNKKVRECYNQWKEIVGEQKFKYHDLWQEYKAATSRFQEMQQWENWRNEQARDELLAEMDSMTKEEPSQALLNKLREISNRWKEIGPISAAKLQEYRDHFQGNYEKIKEKCAPFIEEMNAERIKNLADKEAICAKIEELVNNAEIFWKDKFKTMQELQESWKNIGMVPKENVAALTERFKAAANAFYAQHKENLKAEDVSREANYEKKVALCMEAEAIQESSDWNATSSKLKQLQDAWKATGPVPKSKSDEIWTRFRTACDAFFEKKRAHFEEMDASKQKNLDAKNEVCAKLEAMEAAAQGSLEELKAMESEFKSLGMVPKEAIETVSERFNTIYNKILARLASADAALTAALAEVKTKKLEMIDKVKEFAESAGSNQLADAVREIQKEWREIGSCGAEDSALYKTFREACDDFFTRRRDQLDIQEQARQNNLQKKLLLCEQAEELLNDLSEATVGASMNKVKHLRRLWKEVGAVPREHSEKTWQRFNTACDKVFAFGRKDEPKPAETEAPAEAPAAE